MTTFRRKNRRRFTTIENVAIQDRRLSFKARGLHHLLLSYPENWEVNISHLVSQSDHDGRHSVRAAVKELEAAGYLIATQARAEDSGRFGNAVYDVYEISQLDDGGRASGGSEPWSEKPTTGKPTTGKPTAGKPSTENRTQIKTKNTKDLKTTKDLKKETPLTPQRGERDRPSENLSKGNGSQQTPPVDQKAKKSGSKRKRKSSAAAQSSEQILAAVSQPLQARFSKFWEGYSAFCTERGQSVGAKKQAAIAWVKLADGDFNGKGLTEFNRGVQLWVRHQGDRETGIPHASRFLYSARNGSGAWEDALEQLGGSKDLGEFKTGGSSYTPPQNGPYAIKTAADMMTDQEYGPPSAKVKRLIDQTLNRLSPQEAV